MPAKKSSTGSISGFLPLQVQYDHDTRHTLYVRAHVGGSSSKVQWPEDRTIFMVNVPPDATEREIVLLFKSCGTVEQVVFDTDRPSDHVDDMGSEMDSAESDAAPSPSQSPTRKKRKTVASGSTAEPSASARDQRPKVIPLPSIPLRSLRRTAHTVHVLFLDASSCTRALALAHPHQGSKKPILWPTLGDEERPRGLAHYVAQYEAARPPLEAVRAHADSAIARFDFDLAARKAALRRESKYKKGEALVDEDGFTLVIRGGAYGQAVGGGVGVASRKFMDEYAKDVSGKGSRSKRKRHKEGKEKAAFYAFQVHEKKRDALLELKQKWEQDKAAVEKLKASRKYKPY